MRSHDLNDNAVTLLEILALYLFSSLIHLSLSMVLFILLSMDGFTCPQLKRLDNRLIVYHPLNIYVISKINYDVCSGKT